MKKQLLLLLVGVFGCLFTAVNPVSAQIWTLTSAPTKTWSSVVSSADGSELVAAVNSGRIYTSTNSGATWTQTSAANASWTCVASSADGSELVAVVNGGRIYTSTNSGATWTQTSAGNARWTCVASSADGSELVAVVNGGGIYTSTNSGTTWTLTSAPTNAWSSVASSSDGSELVAAVNGERDLYLDEFRGHLDTDQCGQCTLDLCCLVGGWNQTGGGISASARQRLHFYKFGSYLG